MQYESEIDVSIQPNIDFFALINRLFFTTTLGYVILLVEQKDNLTFGLFLCPHMC